MDPFLQKVLISVVSALVLALLSLLFKSVRSVIFYKRAEYDLLYGKLKGAKEDIEWDIQWEDLRLTISVGDVSNNYLSTVVITQDKHRGKEEMDKLAPSDKFKVLFDGNFQMKLNSIVRRKVRPKAQLSNQAAASNDYVLRFVFGRRRFRFA